MKVYAGMSEGEAEATYELGKYGLLRWRNMQGAFHIMAADDGGIIVYVPNSIIPRDVEGGARQVHPVCPTCHQEAKEVK